MNKFLALFFYDFKYSDGKFMTELQNIILGVKREMSSTVIFSIVGIQ